jgi:C-terminal processing protease CtpA/Prc
MGGGPAAALSFAYCNKLFEPHGYVKTSELGTTGITVDTDAADKALIKAVDAGSPAAAAGVQVGDEVVAVNGKPLTASVGQNAMVLLFGKVGRTDQVTVVRGGARQTVQMTLAEKPKG